MPVRLYGTCERSQNKRKTKSGHIQIDHSLYCSILPTNNAMVSLKDGFTVIRQSEKKDFLSMIYVWLSMICCHGGIPMFFNKKIKIGRPEHSLTPYPPTSNNISFLSYPPPPSNWLSFVFHPLLQANL